MDVETEQLDFESWVQTRGTALLRFGYLVTGDRVRAEEAVQTALIGAWRRWDRLCRSGDPEAYVRRSIVHADVSWWRRFRRKETPVAGTEPLDVRATADHADDLVDRDAAWSLCSSLPTKHRAAVVLRYYEGLSDSEIATILGCSSATVRSQIHRALAALRQRLGVREEVEQS